MLIKMNLKGEYKLVPEGERVLTITKAECTPSGKPDKLKVTFQDSEGGIIMSNYDFKNDISLFAMGKLLETALGFEDGDEFDTKTDPARLVGLKLLCEVKHSQGTKANDKGEFPTFANVRKTLSLVSEDGEVIVSGDDVENESPRNAIANNDEDDDLD